MAAKSVKRLVVVTGFGAGRSRSAMSSLEGFGHKMFLGRPCAAKDRQEELLVAGALDWTIARPVILTNRPASGRIRVLEDPKTWRNGLIARADVPTAAASNEYVDVAKAFFDDREAKFVNGILDAVAKNARS